MQPFVYQAPTSVGEAVALLVDPAHRARPFAGGTDLLVQMRRGLFMPGMLVDVKRIPELNRLTCDSGAGLTLGAAVSCAWLCDHPSVQRAYPGLIDAASRIGGAAIQRRATLGGNLCNAAPSGDSIPAMIVLGATATIAGPQGTRSVPIADFCTAPGKTVLGPGELLISIHFPVPAPHSGARYLRFIPRGEMDIAVAGAGAWLALSDDGSTITAARVALSAVAPTPLFVEAAGAALVGKTPTAEAFAEAAAIAQEAARPISDVRGTAAQRRHLVGVLTRRVLYGALQRAQGETIHD
ncbi:MAG TPA: xanthine dehydrogenase family protein subunit M [Anaerolineae bacterium]|nr:xanthine dehydrogenase family protein subunit M [Anaerolineae bacterium]HQH39881.1 xanthine dehydrogenase family protein subunit M [Anaerolineae bacterium]